jgi:integrase
VLQKLFRAPQCPRWDTLDKETVDEMIFKIPKPRDRLMVELMARGGLRIGEVMKLRARDVEDQKLTLVSPKSGKAREVVFIPQKITQRLEIRHPHRDREQGHPEACESGHHTDVNGKVSDAEAVRWIERLYD